MPEKQTTLPLELWRVTFQYLSVADLCRCSLVCLEWRELVKSLDSTRWKELFLSFKKWKHPNWPNYIRKEPTSWKETYKIHHLASKQWINRSIEVRCSPFFYVFRRRNERRVLQVGHGQDFLTIKSAISAASPFDCILIHSGVYDEQSVLSLKFPIEIVGAEDLGEVVVQMPIEQQSSTARIVNLVLQPGLLRSQNSLPVIIKVATGHLQVDNCKLENGHVQVSSPGSVAICYTSFNSCFVTLRSVGFSRIENCEFKNDDTSAVIVEGLPPVTRHRPLSRPIDGWMAVSGVDSLGLEYLYDLSVNEDSCTSKSRWKNGFRTSGRVEPNFQPSKGLPTFVTNQSKHSHIKSVNGSQVTMVTNDLSHPCTPLIEKSESHKRRFQLDSQSRNIVRTMHGCVIRNTRFSSGKGAVLVRRRGQVWIEGSEMFGLVHGIRCVTGAKLVALNNQIHDCSTSGIFFRERSMGLVAGNNIYCNKEAGVDIRSASDPIVQHNHIHSGRRSGVVILDRGRGIIRDNDIYDNKEAGVYILYKGHPTVKHNRIWSGRAAGVAVTEDGRGQISENDICGMEWGGVDIRNGGNPVVANNLIRNGQADGIVIGEGGKGIVSENDIRGNSGCGVWVLTVAKPVIYGNRIGECGDSGIAFVSNSDLHHDNQQLSSQFIQQEQDQEQHLQPLFFDEDLSSESNHEDLDHPLDFNGPRPDKNFASVENNTIFDNAGHGILFCGNEGLLIRVNSIHGNKGCGINIAKPANITVQDNSICRNMSSGICVDIGCSASIQGNGIYNNQQFGIQIAGKGLFKENDVICNLMGGVQVRGPGDPYVTNNRVQCTKHHGIAVLESARGVVASNVIYECESTAITQHPASTTYVHNNRVAPVKDIYAYMTKEKDCKGCILDPSEVEPDSPPPRPLIANRDNKFPRPTVSRLSMASAGATNIVAHYTNCNGGSRFCVIQ